VPERFRPAALPLALLWTLALVVGLSLPGDELPDLSVLSADKLLHAGAFFGLGVLWLWAYPRAAGRILAAGLRNVKSSRELMRESIEETGRVVAHELDRFLTTLGTIAAMAPLMGLFGTTVGMIEMFSAQTPTGLNPVQLAHGISVALYNTAFGLIVAIPSMIFYRHFRAKVDALIISMEQQAVRLVDIVHAGRDS